MFEIELYTAVAVVTAGLCWYLHRRDQRWGALTVLSTVAGLLWPILAVGALQLGFFVAVKRLVRARRSQTVAVGEESPASTRTPDSAPIRRSRRSQAVERRTECAAALSGGRALASLK